MKTTITILSIILFCNTQILKSQDLGYAFDLGYTHKFFNTSARQLYLGGVISYADTKGERKRYLGHQPIYVLNVGTYYGKYKDKYKWIPALAVGRSLSEDLLLAKLQITPYSINPSISLNVLNAFQIGVGYNFGFKKIDNFSMSGLAISFNINIGTRNHYMDIHY